MSALEDYFAWAVHPPRSESHRLQELAREELGILRDRLTAYTNAMHAKDAYIDTLESWILEHAQHGANCMSGADRKHPCTCGLAKIMEEMP